MTEYGRIHTDGSRSGGQPLIANRKAHTMIIEVLAAWGIEPSNTTPEQLTIATTEALCRAIKQLEDLRQPTHHNVVVAAAPADRIGGGGGLPCGVVGVATQSDADVLADKSDDYAIGFLSVLLERELYENGHTIGEDLAERLAEIAVKTVRHPTQSDALRVTDEMVERLAVYIAKEEARNCKTLGAAVEHRSNWRRIIPEAREMLTAALRQPTQSDALRDALADLLHAVCGKTGFAEAVRRDSGRIYPWPALDLAEAKAIAALEQSK